MKKNIIISPSGNLYGSENVLYDFIISTNVDFDIYVPAHSEFHQRLLNSKFKHNIIPYKNNNLKIFYIKFALMLLFKRVANVYSNEGGHLKYINLLSKLIPRTNFLVHVRIIEDIERLNNISQKIKIITISDFMYEKIKNKKNLTLIYDPFKFSDIKDLSAQKQNLSKLKIGIIGRVSYSKGFEKIAELIRYIDLHYKVNNYIFNFYGHISETPKIIEEFKNLSSLNNTEVHYIGFIKTSEIFKQIDIVLHLAENEPLGRIYLESIDELIPLIGFNSGGIGEIAAKCGITETLVNLSQEEQLWKNSIIKKLDDFKENPTYFIEKMKFAKNGAEKVFSVNNYCNKIQELLK